MPATFYVGDAIEVMGKLPENSVDLVLTSPPFLALRSYLPADHPDKALEGGSQSTPGEFIDWLIDVVEACDRVLAPHGSLCIELGDTYAGSGGAGGDYAEGGRREGQQPFRQCAHSLTEVDGDSVVRCKRCGAAYLPDHDGWGSRSPHIKANPGRSGYVKMQKPGYATGIPVRQSQDEIAKAGSGWPLAKSLSLIPETFRFAMVYGHNPHTGRTTEPWRLRNVVRWVRPNPPVGALGDKFRPATSELMVFCKSAKRYFDLDAVREPYSEASVQRSLSRAPGHIGVRQASGTLRNDEPKIEAPYVLTQSGAPPLDWWNIPPGGYEGAHYACVDEATEALTPDGWKSHKELEDGDLIAAYDLRTDLIKWETAKFVRYDVVDEELVCVEKEQTSQRLTANHRMLVKSRKRGPFVKLAGEVSSGYDLPLSAPWGESGSINGPGAVHAAIFGWFITEGSARPLSRQAYIYQSQTANAAKVDQIRQLLGWSGVPFDERVRDRSNEFPGKGVQVVFVLHDSPLTRWLRDHHKHLPIEYVYEWPEKDAQALFDAMVDGDGHRRADGRISFVQKDKALADAFQCLAIRLGYRAIVKHRGDSDVYTVYCSVNRWVTLRGPDGKRAPIPREAYTGVVWCPQVSSTFWLARRNGKPFITGNTFPPELCVKPIKAMCPEKVCNALVCGHCGHNEPGFNERYLRESLEAGEQRLPLTTPLQEELRRVWGVLRGSESVDVFPEVPVGAQAGDIRAPRQQVQSDRGMGSDLPQGLHQDSEEGSSPSGEGLRPGAPVGDGGTLGPLSGTVGTRPPQERNKGRQPAGESRDRVQRGSSRQGDLPSLRDGLLHSLTCPHCGESGFRVCGEPSRPIYENVSVPRRTRTPDPSTIGGFLQTHRLKKGLTVKQVAEVVGVASTEAGHWFRSDAGARLPDPDQWTMLRLLFPGIPPELDDLMAVTPANWPNVDHGNRSVPLRLSGGPPAGALTKVVAVGFSDCGHDDWRPGLVLDPFAGSGTTLAVATGHGRDAIGIDLDSRNFDLALERVGPFMLERRETPA